MEFLKLSLFLKDFHTLYSEWICHFSESVLIISREMVSNDAINKVDLTCLNKVFHLKSIEKRISMKEKDLLFYNEYEQFYAMASKSEIFHKFCEKAFGEDFSQDGFSDIHQIDRMLQYVPGRKETHILDIGCGNGKMLGYLQKKTGAFIHGFDYSHKAIETARQLFPFHSDFKTGVIGQVDYPEDSFDVIVSMDSMYFCDDMGQFVGQLWGWLRSGGTFFCAYQEGDVMSKTDRMDASELAKALRENGIYYEGIDITRDCYELLKRKREAAMLFQEEFLRAGETAWYDMLLMQTECVSESFDNFRKKMSRYIFVAKKE